MNDEPNDELQTNMGDDQEPVSGVALRSADGSLYFIPDRALETFRVTTASGKAAVQEQFEAASTPGVKEAIGQAPQTFEARHVQIPAGKSMGRRTQGTISHDSD